MTGRTPGVAVAGLATSAALTAHADDTTSVHGITDTASLTAKAVDTGATTFTTPTISGTAVQLSTTADKRLSVPVTYNPTAVATATCEVSISPDDVTYTPVFSRSVPIGVAFAGTVDTAHLDVPAGWWVKTTALTNATVGTCKAW